MAISRALLKTGYGRQCLLCGNEMHRATIGNLCNSCKDGFSIRFNNVKIGPAREFAM